MDSHFRAPREAASPGRREIAIYELRPLAIGIFGKERLSAASGWFGDRQLRR
jgi:hypothetical protein